MGRSISFAIPALLALASACSDGGREVQCMPAGTSRAIARVDRCAVSIESFRFGFLLLGHAGDPPGPMVDWLIARELLAQGAQEAGVPPPPKAEVERQIKDGRLYVMGLPLPPDLIQSDGVFDYRKAKRLAENAGLTIDGLVAEQAREGLAYAMRTRLGEAGVEPWLAERCRRVLQAGRIHVEPDVLARTDDNGKPVPDHYVPCAAWSEVRSR